MMTSGSPSNMSSQNICRWTRTDWKHLREWETVKLMITDGQELGQDHVSVMDVSTGQT